MDEFWNDMAFTTQEMLDEEDDDSILEVTSTMETLVHTKQIVLTPSAMYKSRERMKVVAKSKPVPMERAQHMFDRTFTNAYSKIHPTHVIAYNKTVVTCRFEKDGTRGKIVIPDYTILDPTSGKAFAVLELQENGHEAEVVLREALKVYFYESLGIKFCQIFIPRFPTQEEVDAAVKCTMAGLTSDSVGASCYLNNFPAKLVQRQRTMIASLTSEQKYQFFSHSQYESFCTLL